MQRPGMVALLSYLDALHGEYYVVIFDDLKRFARDTRFHLDLRDAFRARSARIECLNFAFDETPEGEFIETIMTPQGALERKQNGRQVAQKMKARMQSGYWVHAAPVGYKYETVNGRGKMLFPHATLAGTVREALEGFASGRLGSQAEVRRFFQLNPDFPRNRKGGITNQRIADVLNNPLYTGHICSKTYGIDWLKGHHDPLISIDLFDKVQGCRQRLCCARLCNLRQLRHTAAQFVVQRSRPQLRLLPVPSDRLCQLRQINRPRQAGRRYRGGDQDAATQRYAF
jgi:site-specific DNA recombinase